MWEFLIVFLFIVAIHSVLDREKEDVEQRAKVDKETSDQRIRELEIALERERIGNEKKVRELLEKEKKAEISAKKAQGYLTRDQLIFSLAIFLILALIMVFVIKALSSN